MKLMYIFVLFLFFILSSCAHTHVRGSVALVHSDSAADVCLGSSEVSVGDQVLLYRNVCKGSAGSRRGDISKCEKRYLGAGQVTGVLDDHYSTIKTLDSIKLESGLIVEKK